MLVVRISALHAELMLRHSRQGQVRVQIAMQIIEMEKSLFSAAPWKEMREHGIGGPRALRNFSSLRVGGESARLRRAGQHLGICALSAVVLGYHEDNRGRCDAEANVSGPTFWSCVSTIAPCQATSTSKISSKISSSNM